MANPYHHALSSVKKWGSCYSDYMEIHEWFDESKMMMAGPQHRALRHHTEGIFMCERFFGTTLLLSNGKRIPTRWVGEQHVTEDCGFIPSMQDWFKHIQLQPWMLRARKLSKEL